MKTSGNFWKNVGAIGGGLLIVFHMFRPYIIREVNHTLNRLNHTHFLATDKKEMVTKGEITKTVVEFREKFPKGESGLSNDSKSAKASQMRDVEKNRKKVKQGRQTSDSDDIVIENHCFLCDGNGWCSVCGGYGFFYTVSGMLPCTLCRGRQTCNNCNGKGYTITTITGNGMIINSRGAGQTGVGQYHIQQGLSTTSSKSYDDDDDCPICHGDRKCYNCGGRGEKEYEMFFTGGHSERHDCKICDGDGKCPICHGSGKMR